MEHLAVLIIPLALVFAIVHDRWRRLGNVLTILLMLLIFILPWTLYLFAVNRFGTIAHEIIFLFLPLSTLIGLYWIRWWAIRPPRILSDFASRP
jgi:4-amino-4-deoxy-L-arabinose transferase-like glycosyltransferase